MSRQRRKQQNKQQKSRPKGRGRRGGQAQGSDQGQGQQQQGGPNPGRGRRHGRFNQPNQNDRPHGRRGHSSRNQNQNDPADDGFSFLKNRTQKRHEGKIDKNRKGFGFVICFVKDIPDAYVDAKQASYLLDGDIVRYTLKRDGKRVYAHIAEVVGHTQSLVFGQVMESKGRYFIDTGIDFFAFKDKSKEIVKGDWVTAKIVDFPTHEHPARVILQESMGNELTPKQDVAITISKYSLPNEFPAQVIKEADEAIERAKVEMLDPPSTRRDYRDRDFVTIDGEDAKDFDDAILVEAPSSGPAFILYVAIADVSFFVRDGTELDKEALNRATSVYFPGIAIPMLPHQLSDNVCSLRPKEDKLAMVAEIHYDKAGGIIATKFYDAIIKTIRRLTYTEVHEFIESKNRDKYSDVEKPLSVAYQLYRKLLEGRKNRGVLDFDLAESKLQLDKDQMPVSVFKAPKYESHKLIEEFMIAANQVVAKALKEGRQKALYRIHEHPDPEVIQELNLLAKSLGFNYLLREVSPKSFSDFLKNTLNNKGTRTLHTMVLRSQKQARYSPSPIGHFGLALRDYAHFTSPIRRYPDLLVHRALKRLIGTHDKADKFNKDHDFEELGEVTSERERRATEAERFIVRRKQCWFMKGREGEKFPGMITGVIAKGLFVEIADFALEGFVPKDSLDGHYEYDEMRVCLRKRPGHTVLGLGDSLEVVVKNVSVDDNEITLALTDEGHQHSK